MRVLIAELDVLRLMAESKSNRAIASELSIAVGTVEQRTAAVFSKLGVPDVPGGEASFAAGVLLYALGLLMIAMSTWAPRWVRVVGALAAVPLRRSFSDLFQRGSNRQYRFPRGNRIRVIHVTIIGWTLTVPIPSPFVGERGEKIKVQL